MSREEPLEVVVAVFDAEQRIRGDAALHERLATNLETVAESAVLVAKDDSGALTLTGSDHSVGRNLAELTAKLLIALPLGFHGVLAMTSAGTKIAAAQRKRQVPPDVDVADVGVIVDRIPDGGLAIIEVVPTSLLKKAVKAAEVAGARGVWHAPAEDVEAALRAAQHDDPTGPEFA